MYLVKYFLPIQSQRLRATNQIDIIDRDMQVIENLKIRRQK